MQRGSDISTRRIGAICPAARRRSSKAPTLLDARTMLGSGPTTGLPLWDWPTSASRHRPVMTSASVGRSRSGMPPSSRAALG
jgi:hypothetical protein